MAGRTVRLMRNSLLALAATLSIPAFSAEPALLTVRVYDLASAGPVVDQAAEEVSRSLAHAGVQLVWRRHGAPAVPWGPDNPFNPERTPRDLIVRLLPEDAARKLTGKRSVAGVAYPVGNGHFRYLATLFYDRVTEVAAHYRAPVGVILGNLIAHELGHLLLGPDAHAASGLMRCPWDVAEFRAAERGELRFTPQQARAIRADVARRVKAAAGGRRW